MNDLIAVFIGTILGHIAYDFVKAHKSKGSKHNTEKEKDPDEGSPKARVLDGS